MKTITTKYASACGTCCEQIPAGAEAGYDGKPHHLECAAKRAELARLVSESDRGTIVLVRASSGEVSRARVVLDGDSERIEILDGPAWSLSGDREIAVRTDDLYDAINRGSIIGMPCRTQRKTTPVHLVGIAR